MLWSVDTNLFAHIMLCFGIISWHYQITIVILYNDESDLKQMVKAIPVNIVYQTLIVYSFWKHCNKEFIYN